MDNDDPLLRELLELDDVQDEDVPTESASYSTATQQVAPVTQLGVTRQHVHQPGGESAAVRGALQPAQPVAKPTGQSAATPQQQVVAQQSPSRNKILGSETLYSIVVVLTRLLKDEALKNQVKSLIRNVATRSDIPDQNAASAAFVHRLREIVGNDMFKQASTLAHKIRLQQQLQQQQQQQLKAAGAAQQQQGPSSQPQAMAVQNPAQGAPSMSRGVSPALPTHSQPLLQQQLQQQQQQQKPALAASQPAQPLRQFPLGQQPAPSARAVPVSAAMSHAQHQLGIPRQPGLVPGAAPGRSPSPGVYPGAPSPVPTAGQQPQGSSLHPGLSLPQPAQQSAQQPKPKAAAHSKRVLEGGQEEGRDTKRSKGPAAREKKEREKEKEKDGDVDDYMNADAFIDMEQETNQLMAGLAQQRQLGTARLAKAQLLSEWRVANEILKQMTKAGLKRVKPECFEILQLAFQAQATRMLSKAHTVARHRQDAARKLPDMVIQSDPRRGVLQIERREKAKHDARLAAEREELLKAASSRRADDETKEKAQKAKAELQGKQQASAANAAVAATLGGKGAKWNKWDKWGGGGGGAAGGGASAAGKKKGSKAGPGKEVDAKGSAAKGAEAGTAAVPSAGQKDGKAERTAEPTVRFAEGSKGGAAGGASAEGEKGEKNSAALKSSRSRAGLAALAGSGGDEGGDTIHLRDLIAAMERDPMYCKSTLLYSLCNKI